MNRVSNIWVFLTLMLFIYLIYQSSFTWYKVEGETKKDNEDVVLITIQEKRYGMVKRTFESLEEKLKTWELNRENKEVKFKYISQLPGEETKVVMIYDRGYDSFERFAKVLNVYTIPSQYKFDNKPFISIESVNENGDVYLVFEGKKIKIERGEKYRDWKIEDYWLTKTVIENNGIYKKEDFKTKGYYTLKLNKTEIKKGKEIKGVLKVYDSIEAPIRGVNVEVELIKQEEVDSVISIKETVNEHGMLNFKLETNNLKVGEYSIKVNLSKKNIEFEDKNYIVKIN